MATRHRLTDEEYEILSKVTDRVHPAMAAAIADFVNQSISNGMDAVVAGAALAQYMLVNLSHTLAICSGMPSNEIDSDGIKILAARVQRKLVQDVSEYVRVRTPDDEIADYVSPQAQKDNDAAEHADYEYDRDKEERIDDSRN